MNSLPPPEYDLKLKKEGSKTYVFDPIRKKYFVLTPEEWVRQHVIHFLIHEKGYPASLMAVERTVEGTQKRFDILIFTQGAGAPWVIIECKRASQKLSQATLNQIGRYNMSLNVPYLMVTNWENWMVAKVDKEKKSFKFLKGIPDYVSL